MFNFRRFFNAKLHHHPPHKIIITLKIQFSALNCRLYSLQMKLNQFFAKFVLWFGLANLTVIIFMAKSIWDYNQIKNQFLGLKTFTEQMDYHIRKKFRHSAQRILFYTHGNLSVIQCNTLIFSRYSLLQVLIQRI